MPDEMFAYAEGAAARGLKAIIAGAGGAAHLPGMLAAKTTVPVLGVPVSSRQLQGVDSLYSIVQMPRGIPVATFAIGVAGAANAALFAIAMLATGDESLRRQLDAFSRAADRCSPGADGRAEVSAMREASPAFVAPGATLGVLGGGQLGRMFAHAAQRSGYAVAVLDPDPDSPAGRVAEAHFCAGYLDTDALARFAERCDAVTTEFENVPAAALEALAARRPVAPSAASIAICQDRRLEKAAFTACGVPCAPYVAIEHADDLAAVDASLLPGILKTARLGYDGKGQRRVADRASLAAAFHELGDVACVLEKMLPLAAEISVVVARDRRGETVELPVQENLHRDGILAVTRVPAQGPAHTAQREAVERARRVAESIGYVGVLCVEFFVLADGALVANEMAPRPHNSGHYSIDACDVSQFDLQVRVLTGAPWSRRACIRRPSCSIFSATSGCPPAALAWNPIGSVCLRCPVRTCTSTAKAKRAPAARWDI